MSALPSPSQAQTTQTWLNGGSNEWSTIAPNWDAGVAWTNGNNASFAGTGVTVDVAGNVTFNSILFGTTGWTIADSNTDGTFSLAGVGRITTSGVFGDLGATISENIAGANLVKAGASILVLSGANTYTGTTTVELGTLQINNSGALGSTTGVTVSSGGAVGLGNNVTVSGIPITINGSGSGDNIGALKATGTGTSVWTGNVTIGSANTRVGAVQPTGVLEISGAIDSGGVAHGLNIRGANAGGTVLLSNANNTYLGETTVIAGVLKVGVDDALPTGTVVKLGNAQGQGTATLNLNGFDQRVAGVSAVANNDVATFVTNTSGTASVFTVANAGAIDANVFITGNLSLVKEGTGTFTLSKANTYTGATTVKQSVLQIDHAGALGGTSGVTVESGGSVGLNNVTVSGVSITIHGSGSGDSVGGLKAVGSGTSVWTGNVIIGVGGSRVGTTLATGVLEIAGAISSSDAVSGFTVRTGNDGGTVLLSNANNTYAGPTSVIVGVLKAGVDDALPTGTVVTLGNAAGVGSATFDLNGFDQRVLAVTQLTDNNVVAKVTNDSATAAVLTVDNADLRSTGNVFITGKLSLVKDGSGTFRLNSANTYTGSTTVNAGTLEISGLLGSVAEEEFILNGGTFSINNSTTGTNNADRIADDSNITFRDGDLTFTGSLDAGVNSSETVGDLVLDRGYQTIRIANSNVNQMSTFTASEFTRDAGGGVAFVTGTNLGMNSTSTANVSRFFVATAPTLIGSTNALPTGINSAAKDTKIVPYLLGSSTGSATTPDTFVTYDAGTGFRPLDPTTEFTQNSFVTGHNTRITAASTMNPTTAINSLIVSGSNTLSIGSGQTLTVTSGAILFSSGAGTISGGSSTSTLAFGSQEAIIYVNGGNSTISTRITGTGGLTVAGTGTLVLNLNASSSNYTGDTTLLSGITAVGVGSTGTPGAVTSGPLGLGKLIFAGGAIRTTTGGASPTTRTIHNNIIFKADTTLAGGGNATGLLEFAGDVTLTEGDRVLTNSAPSTTTFSGDIGEDGQKRGITVTGTGAGAVVFSGANTYTGATKVTGTTTLLINGSHSGGDSYHVASGATLGGGGTLSVVSGGSVTIAAGGTLSVGNGTAGAATLNITTSAGGALVFTNNTSVIKLDILSDSSAGTGSDQSLDAASADRLVVSGNTELNGARLIISTALDSTTFSVGDRWKVFDWITAWPEGSFTINPVMDLPALSGNFWWDTSDLYTGGTITVVPEPSRMLLLMGGVTAAMFRRRRRGVTPRIPS